MAEQQTKIDLVRLNQIDFEGIPDVKDSVSNSVSLSEISDVDSGRLNQINFDAFPDKGEANKSPEVLDMPEFRIAPEETGKRFVFSEGEVFGMQIDLFTKGLISDIYGEEGIQDLAESQKKIEFFMSRAPRIAMAYAAPVHALAYEVLDQAKSLIVSKIKGDEFDLLERRMISELIPEKIPTPVKVAANLAEVLADVAIVGGMINLAKEGLLKGAFKEIGQKVAEAGGIEGEVGLSQVGKEAIRKVLKNTTIEKAAKVFIKAKKFRVFPKGKIQIGVSNTTTCPVTGREVTMVRSVVPGEVGTGSRVNILGKPIFVSEKLSVSSKLLMDLQEEALKHKTAFDFIEKIKSMPIEEQPSELVTKPLVVQKKMLTQIWEDVTEENITGVRKVPETKTTPPKTPKKKKVKTPKDLGPKLYHKPGLGKFPTSQSRYAELLGIKRFVEPLETAKLERDTERWAVKKAISHIVKKLKKGKTAGTTMSPEEMAVALNKYIDAPKTMNEEETAVFNYFREMTREYLARENEVLERMGLDPIKDIGAYFSHIIDDTCQGATNGTAQLPEQVKLWAEKNITGKVFNPMEIERKTKDQLLEYFSRDLEAVMHAMVDTATKVIYFSEPKKVLGEMLGLAQKDVRMYKKLSVEDKALWDAQWGVQQEMPKEVRTWLEEYVKIVLLGEEQTTIDTLANQMLAEGPVADIVNKMLEPFGKHLGERALTDMLVAFSKLPLYGVIGGFRPKMLLRNKFQTVQNIALHGIVNTVKGIFPNSQYPVLQKLKEESLFLNTYSGMEDLPPDLEGKVKQALMASFQWSAVSNVTHAMNAAYHFTVDLIQNPEWKDQNLGWADSKRTYNEDPNFFYPSELEKLKKEMEYGAHTAHYSYVAMGMPEVFRYRAGAPFTRLQSWWMNHWFIFHREAATRAITGHTGYDPNLKVSPAARINYLKYLIIGGLILNTLGYERSYMFGTAPTALPPSAQLAGSLYTMLTVDDSTAYGKNKKREAYQSFKQAALTFIPMYLTIKDIAALMSGEKNWTEYIFYKKSKASKASKESFRPR